VREGHLAFVTFGPRAQGSVNGLPVFPGLMLAVEPAAEPQAHGLDLVEFRVAGHAGSTPRALAKVASGGELSRLALAIAVTTAQADSAALPTLIFDEIDSGVGGTVHTFPSAVLQYSTRCGRTCPRPVPDTPADSRAPETRASPTSSDTWQTAVECVGGGPVRESSG
jgi:hypothetical protein